MATEGGKTGHHLSLRPRLAEARHRIGEAFDMMGKKAGKGCAQSAERPLLIRGQGGEVVLDRRGPIAFHWAAFIWKPSSSLSEGATG